MTIAVVTGWSPFQREAGLRFVELFRRFWPHDVGLFYYTEQPVVGGRGVCRSLWDCAGARGFVERHVDTPAVHGRVPMPCWTERERERGRSFRTDAVRFAKQAFMIEDAIYAFDEGDVMFWVEPEVQTIRDVPRKTLEIMMHETSFAYLGREEGYSDTTLIGFRVTEQARQMAHEVAEIYRRQEVFSLAEWHLGAVIDPCRSKLEARGFKTRDLTPNCRGRAWPMSPLAAYTDLQRPTGKQKNGYRLSSLHRV